MAFDSYNGLIAEVLAMLNREGEADLEAQAPTWIALCEAVIRRQQQWFRQFYSLANSGAPLDVTAYPMELPNYVRDVHALWNSTAAAHGEIEILTPSAWRDFVSANSALGNVPRKGIIVPQMDSWLVDPDGAGGVAKTGPKLYLWPQPPVDGSVKIDFEFTRDIAPLDANTVNGLFIRHPDLYFYGTLIESAPFLQHDERLALWQSRFDQAMREINVERERAQAAASRKRPQLPRQF